MTQDASYRRDFCEHRHGEWFLNDSICGTWYGHRPEGEDE